MNRLHSLWLPVAMFVSTATFDIDAPAIYAQQMDHAWPTVPSSQLTIRGLDGKSITLTPEDLAAMPHKAVSVFNEHTKANEKYAGVPLADLLAKVNVPLGEKIRDPARWVRNLAELSVIDVKPAPSEK